MPFQFVFMAMMTIVPIVNNRRSYLNRITHAARERRPAENFVSFGDFEIAPIGI